VVFIKDVVSIISLTGFMFSGKTSTGRLIAEKTGFGFYDVDNLIEEKCSMSVSKIFEKHGEAYFREAESAVVKEIFESGLKRTVVALGGGTICDTANFEIINGRSLLIYLKAPYAEILKRKKAQAPEETVKRPLASKTNGDEFGELFKRRSAIYEQARLKIDCGGLNIEETAGRIIKLAEMKEIN